MSSEIVISVANLSKSYQIYAHPSHRLKQAIVPKLYSVLGRSHPQAYFSEFKALTDISFEIMKGETVGIVGKNGSGKSTLLQLITGTLTPTAGDINTTSRVAALLELGSGFNPEFSGRENVYLNASILGLSRVEIDEKLDDILAFADIGEYIDQPVKTYSSGMFVRLAFAIHANIDPDIFIIDEALAVGDAYFVHRCMLRLRQFQEQGKTILFVSHDSTAVKNLCTRAIWLKGGEVKKIGAASLAVDAYLSDLFGVKEASVPDQGAQTTSPAPTQPNQLETNIPNIDKRTGNQACTIIGVGLYSETMQPITMTNSNSIVILRISARNNSIESGTPLAFGYIFRSAKGIELASTNSIIEGVNINSCQIGDAVTVSMRITIPRLHPGSYSFSLAVGYVEQDGNVASGDLIENALVSQIATNVEMHAMMSFDTLFTVERPLEIN